jgi:YihY family inner membrane protein
MPSDQAPTQSGPASAAAKRAPTRFEDAVRFLPETWQRILTTRGVPTLRYLLKPEVHTFAFSVAANAILSFFPFMLLMLWLIRNVFHSQAMTNVVAQLLRDELPVGQDLVVRNLDSLVRSRQGAKLASVIILLVTSTGVFLPLELALNHIWGFTKNRSYLGNQIVSLALAFACGILAMISVGLVAGNQLMIQFMMMGNIQNIFFKGAAYVVLKGLALLTSIAIFFLIYWLLPNGKIRARSVLPAAACMGVLWELSKYAYMKALPWLDFREVYGPFSISVTLMFWAFLSGLMLLAGAHLAYEFEPQTTLTESSNDEVSGHE